MNFDLSGRTAVVCGSSSGIGHACAHRLASLGAACVLVGRDEARLSPVLASLPRAAGRSHRAVAADLGTPAEAAGRLTAELDGAAVHILVNNTGGPPGGSAIDASPADLLAAFQSQLIAAHVLAQAFVPGMKAARYGRIINITSTSVKQPIPNLGISNIVRPAVAAWAKCLATELGGFGITANNVLPGYTRTDRLASLLGQRAARQNIDPAQVERDVVATIPAGRLAEAHEIAGVVAFLASPEAAYVNGINVPVDGGRLGCL